MHKAAEAMMTSVRETLTSLSNRGTRTLEDHRYFEAILTALIPNTAKEQQILTTILELLGITKRQLKRARKYRADISAWDAAQGGTTSNFSFVMKASTRRAQRNDLNLRGRELCRTFWHSSTRLDTNARKKKRYRVARNTYIEHWRHIQYDTNRQVWEAFQSSAEYGAYLLLGGAPISESLFFQMKCWCIDKSDHEECACPLCTQMFELMRDWHRQRTAWYREADKRRIADPDATGECTCGYCEPDDSYRTISKSIQAFNDFVLCPKQAFPDLEISDGPHACAEVKLRRRQCCCAPLLSDHVDADSTASCQDCEDCGYDKRMPYCPIEHTSDPAKYKVYAPSGANNQEVLQEIDCTRAEFMQQLKKIAKLKITLGPTTPTGRTSTPRSHART